MEVAVDHIVLATPNVDRSVAFYSDVPEPEFISPGGILRSSSGWGTVWS